MPGRSAVGFQADAEECFDYPEEPSENPVFGKVLLYFLLRERITRLQQLLGNVGDIPRFHLVDPKFLARKGAQVGNVPLGEGPRLDRQVAQEVEHLRHRLGHFRDQRNLGEAGVAKQFCFFPAQFENAPDQRRVVHLGGTEFAARVA